MARSLSEIRERSRQRAQARAAARAELKNTAYEIFIGALSILSIVNLVFVYVIAGDSALELVLSVMNALFSAIFLGDFIYRISTAPSPGRYFFRGFGWADLLASLPFPQFKILRLFRLLRVFRLLRELGPRTVWATLDPRPRQQRADDPPADGRARAAVRQHHDPRGRRARRRRQHHVRLRRALVHPRHDLDGRLRRPVPGDQCRPAHRHLIIVVGVGIFGTFTGYLANLFLGPRKGDTDSGGGDGDGCRCRRGRGRRNGRPADAEADADQPSLARHAARGVAAGAAAGAVSAGVAAGSGRADDGGAGGSTPAALRRWRLPTAAIPEAAAMPETAAIPEPAVPGAIDGEATAERLRALLAQSEQAMAEIRRLLADATP